MNEHPCWDLASCTSGTEPRENVNCNLCDGGQNLHSLGWDRVKVSENLGAHWSRLWLHPQVVSLLGVLLFGSDNCFCF